jgi:hypothetical protein
MADLDGRLDAATLRRLAQRTALVALDGSPCLAADDLIDQLGLLEREGGAPW